MHENDYIHRNLNLENILIDQNGYIRVADFALSRKLDKNEDAKTITGK